MSGYNCRNKRVLSLFRNTCSDGADVISQLPYQWCIVIIMSHIILCLRLFAVCLLDVKRCTRTKFGERCFSHAGPAAWNSLPASIKLTTGTNRFKKLLKSNILLAPWTVCKLRFTNSHLYFVFVWCCTDGEPVVCTASAAGDVAFWDLEKRKLHSELHAAHNASVTGMKCLPSQPVLVTSSSDNALKVSFTFTLQLYATAFYGVRCFFQCYLYGMSMFSNDCCSR